MNRRSFLKILGVASTAIILPTSLQYLVNKVVSGDYNEDLLREMFGDILNKLTPEELKWLDSLNETYYLYKFNNNVTVTINPKAKYFKDKIIQQGGVLLETSNNIFEASIKERQYDLQFKDAGLASNGQPYFWPRVRSRRAVIDRPNNKSWQNSRGQRLAINSKPIRAWKGVKKGNSRWNNLRIEEVEFFRDFESQGHAASTVGMTTSAVSQVVNGKRKFGGPLGSKTVYIFKEI